MRKKLILMFLSTTIVAYLFVGAIAVHVIESYFFEQSLQLINTSFEGLQKNKPLDIYNTKTKNMYFEDAGFKVWEIEGNEVIYQSSEITLPQSPIKFSLENKDDLYSFQWEDGDDTYLLSSFYVDGKSTTVVGININHHMAFFDTVNTLILWLTFAVGLLAAIYSVVIVNNGLLPLKQFEGYLSQIRPGNLDVRIPTKELPAELEALGLVQNSMLDRLDEGFKRLSDFSSDIAHELRTPLTNMSTQTQVILSSDRELPEYIDTLGSNLEELERINQTICDTLYLAKAENSLLHQKDEDLDINKEIAHMVDFHNIVAEEKDLKIILRGHGTYFCDRLMFQRVITNLLSNAIRHAANNSEIKIIIMQTYELLKITVLNTGDIIADTSLPFIFDRFYRGDKSRKYVYGFGTGLGLAITKSIVETYNGIIWADSQNGKTKFVIEIPRTASA